MKVAILAGGIGSRLGERTADVPKALVDIDGRPLIWHVMQRFAGFGAREFVVAAGHLGDRVDAYFNQSTPSNWCVKVVDTGSDTDTGGRLKRLTPSLGGRFWLAWCDGVTDANLDAVRMFHAEHGHPATLLAAHPPSRFGHLTLEGQAVRAFEEKPVLQREWINAGCFILDACVLDRIDGDDSSIERDLLPELARAGQLMACPHSGFWRCVDTIRDLEELRARCRTGDAPWLV